jgi:CheY-like chemotaxis protein
VKRFMKSKVMVVDDTEGIRDLLSAILEREGYEAILKTSAAELTAAFTQTQPDIILLDLVLPDGLQFDSTGQRLLIVAAQRDRGAGVSHLNFWSLNVADGSAERADLGKGPLDEAPKVTEIGTLELWCVSRDEERRWKLEFNLRERGD